MSGGELGGVFTSSSAWRPSEVPYDVGTVGAEAGAESAADAESEVAVDPVSENVSSGIVAKSPASVFCFRKLITRCFFLRGFPDFEVPKLCTDSADDCLRKLGRDANDPASEEAAEKAEGMVCSSSWD